MVNIRRGIVAPPVLIDINGVDRAARHQGGCALLKIGAAATLAEVAAHPQVIGIIPVVAQAAGHIAGPTQRNMGTVGGNLCLDTRCIFYNQSEWWRDGQSSLPENHRRNLPRRAEEPRRLLRHFLGRSGAGTARARRRNRHRRAGGQAHDAARRSLYRLCAAGRAGDGNARRRQVFFVAAAGRVHRRRAREKYARPALGLRQDPHPPLDRISGHRRRRGVAARRPTSSPICASPSPAPIRGRCGLPAPPHYAAARSMRACSKASTRWCAIRSWR